MTELQVIYWRDIPAQVIAGTGRGKARRQLDPRFAAAIDRAAIRAKLHGSDDYLAQWRRGAPAACEQDPEAAVEAEARRLEAAYPDERLRALVRAGGLETQGPEEKAGA